MYKKLLQCWVVGDLGNSYTGVAWLDFWLTTIGRLNNLPYLLHQSGILKIPMKLLKFHDRYAGFFQLAANKLINGVKPRL